LAIYAIYLPHARKEPLHATEDELAMARIERLTGVRFVRQGFSFGAFLLGPLWLAYRGLWLTLGIWFLAILTFFILIRITGLGEGLLFAFMILLALLLGLEGFGLCEERLRRKGFHLDDIIVASDRDAGEARFFSLIEAKARTGEETGVVPALAPPPAASPTSRTRPAQAGASGPSTTPMAPREAETSRDLLGLFPSEGPRK